MNKTADYLGALDWKASEEYCAIKGIDPMGVNPFSFDSAEQVMDCMSTFLNEGISLSFVFTNADAWGLYMRSISEERYHAAINLLLAYGTPADFMYYIRACYRMGFPAISDQDFDALEKLYLLTFPHLSFINEQTADDDVYSPLVKEAIKLSGVRSTGKSAITAVKRLNLDKGSTYDDLNTEKSTSIRPVVTPQEAFDFWCSSPICRVHFSLKIDGINTKLATSSENGLELALSRGRATDSIDYTDAVKVYLEQNQINPSEVPGRITGESFVNIEDLKVVQSHYPDKSYKTPKSTAMAMLRSPHNFIPEDLKLLSFMTFDYNGLKPDKAYSLLTAAGFQTPPSLEVEGSEIPRSSLADFNTWMETNVLNKLYAEGQRLGIGSDGVVMFLLADINTERKDKYSDSNIAIKYGHWSAATYVSRVTNIVFEQRRVEASIVLEIEPCLTRDMNTATRVGVGSPDILIRDDVRVGDLIEFERKSEAYNVYLRKRE